jgi:hypothetical protein
MLLHELKTFAMETPLSIEYTELTLADVQMVFVDSLDQFVVTTIGHINAAQRSGPLAGIESAGFLVPLAPEECGNHNYGGKVYCGPVSRRERTDPVGFA